MKVAPFGVSAWVLRAVTTTVAPPSMQALRGGRADTTRAAGNQGTTAFKFFCEI